jgi:hypothetical protein
MESFYLTPMPAGFVIFYSLIILSKYEINRKCDNQFSVWKTCYLSTAGFLELALLKVFLW